MNILPHLAQSLKPHPALRAPLPKEGNYYRQIPVLKKKHYPQIPLQERGAQRAGWIHTQRTFHYQKTIIALTQTHHIMAKIETINIGDNQPSA